MLVCESSRFLVLRVPEVLFRGKVDSCFTMVLSKYLHAIYKYE